jgi:hypothetical protein
MEQTNGTIIEDRRNFISVRNEQKLLDWVGVHAPDSPERRAIRGTLNLYEFVAVGIREKTLDEALYKRSYRTTLVGDWVSLKPFVMEVRRQTQTPTLYCEYEYLAGKWATVAERDHVQRRDMAVSPRRSLV